MNTHQETLPTRSWIPAGITAANIACGFVAMAMVAAQRYDAAVYLLVLAVFLDIMDGRVARLLHATSVFGKQLDSFCDVISFGAAPAFLVLLAVLQPLGSIGLGAALLFLLAGVFRLSRFNLLSDEHSKARRTVGLPIPVGASYLMAITLMRDRIDVRWALVVVVIMSIAMASRMQLPDLKGKSRVTAMLIIGICTYLAFVTWPSWPTFWVWNSWNLLIIVAARLEDRRPSAAEALNSTS